MKKFILLVLLISPFIALSAQLSKSMIDRIPQIVEYKQKGIIGEQPDGHLGLVSSDPTAAAIVAAENQDRDAYYQRAADEVQKPLDAVKPELIKMKLNTVPSGQYYKDASGSWVRKP